MVCHHAGAPAISTGGRNNSTQEINSSVLALLSLLCIQIPNHDTYSIYPMAVSVYTVCIDAVYQTVKSQM